MNIIDFYNSLDALNLIIFWGIVIVIILLIIFFILIISQKRKNTFEEEKVEEIIEGYIPVKEENITYEEEDLIQKNTSFFEKKLEEPKEENVLSIFPEKIKEEKFVAEEYVPNIVIQEPKKIPKEEVIERKPYQKNVLREMSLSQTSPIGIIRKDNKEEEKITDLQNSLTIEKENNKEYINEVKEKLSNAINNEEIVRTEYELKQEEDAIISYEELMQKKDSIEIVDEEEAVISIEELIEKKKQEEKIYKLTEEEENNSFINELKQFREDL